MEKSKLRFKQDMHEFAMKLLRPNNLPHLNVDTAIHALKCNDGFKQELVRRFAVIDHNEYKRPQKAFHDGSNPGLYKSALMNMIGDTFRGMSFSGYIDEANALGFTNVQSQNVDGEELVTLHEKETGLLLVVDSTQGGVGIGEARLYGNWKANPEASDKERYINFDHADYFEDGTAAFDVYAVDGLKNRIKALMDGGELLPNWKHIPDIALVTIVELCQLSMMQLQEKTEQRFAALPTFIKESIGYVDATDLSEAIAQHQEVDSTRKNMLEEAGEQIEPSSSANYGLRG